MLHNAMKTMGKEAIVGHFKILAKLIPSRSTRQGSCYFCRDFEPSNLEYKSEQTAQFFWLGTRFSTAQVAVRQSENKGIDSTTEVTRVEIVDWDYHEREVPEVLPVWLCYKRINCSRSVCSGNS